MQPIQLKAALCLSNISSAVAKLSMTLLMLAYLSVPGYTQTYQVIHNFTYGTGGDWPWSELTIGPGGHMYGTTLFGGDNHSFYCYDGCGIVYDIYQRDSSWVFTPLHEFLIQEGSNPHSGVIIGPDGALYGTTLMGGMQGSDCDVGGCGTVYKLQPSATAPRTPLLSWDLHVVYYFTGGDNDGGDPSSGLVLDQAGNMYGANGGGPDNCGLVFQLSRNNGYWIFNEIYNGFYCPDGNVGIAPGGMLVDSQGNLYGVTGNGGHLSLPLFEGRLRDRLQTDPHRWILGRKHSLRIQRTNRRRLSRRSGHGRRGQSVCRYRNGWPIRWRHGVGVVAVRRRVELSGAA